jgi:hypothetical protein
MNLNQHRIVSQPAYTVSQAAEKPVKPSTHKITYLMPESLNDGHLYFNGAKLKISVQEGDMELSDELNSYIVWPLAEDVNVQKENRKSIMTVDLEPLSTFYSALDKDFSLFDGEEPVDANLWSDPEK